MKNLIKLNIGASLIICLLLIGKGIYYTQNCDSTRFVIAKYGTMFSGDVSTSTQAECDESVDLPGSILPAKMAKSEEVEALMSTLYENRQSTYQTNKSDLKTVLIWLFFGLLLAARIIFTKPLEIDIPIVNFKIPISLFYVFMPVVFIYLWVQFGLHLTAAIDSRMVLEQLTDQIEVVDGKAVSYYFSNARTFVDQGYVDFWCTYFYNVFKGGVNNEIHNRVAFSGLFIIYGSIMGVIHAVCLLLTVFNQNSKLRVLLNVLVLGTLTFCSYLLVTWYQHAAFLIAWIWGVALICLVVWYVMSSEPAEDESTIQDVSI